MPEKRVKVHYYKGAGKWVQNTRGIPAGEGIYDNKKDAVREGRELAKRYGAKLVIHKRNGALQKTTDYSSGSNSSGRGRSSGSVFDLFG